MRRFGLLVLSLGHLVGCWYGPPEDVAQIEHALRRWNSHQVAVAVSQTRQRPPRGLATFPNGGVPRVLDASVDLYFGDPGRAWLRHVRHFPAPVHLLHGLGAHVEGWEEGAVYLAISGCAQNECWGDLRNYQRFRVGTDGTVQPVDSVPETARPRGGSVARMQGEHRYLRIGHGSTTVEASLDPGLDREVVFRLDRDSGVLGLEEPYPFAVPSTPGMEPPRAPGEILETSTVARSVVDAECLDYPWRHPPAWPAAQQMSSRCQVVETGSLAATGRLRWTWARYLREAVYAAPPDVLDGDLGLYPDTVSEEEVILLVGRDDEGVVRPAWHDRAETAYEFLRPPRAAALPDETVLMVHRRCLNGTGGCADHPYRLTTAGTVEPLHLSYASQLGRRLPVGWQTAKGIQLAPDDLLATAPVYLPIDANCCPSFVAAATLRVSGDSLVADSIAIEPAASGVWLIQPGERFGPIGPESVESQIEEWLGPASIARSEIELGEGFCTPGTVIFPGHPLEIEVAWSDSMRTRPAFVRTSGAGIAWRTPAGVRIGTPLEDLERIKGGPVEFSGFGWDYGGSARWEEGEGDVRLQLAVDSESAPRLQQLARTDARVREIDGDRTVRSDHPVIRQIRVTVERMGVHWGRVADTKECEGIG